MPDNLTNAAYTAARKLGRKHLSDNANNEYKGYLPVLDDRIKNVEIAGEIPLGMHEIPLRKIIGTRTAARSNAFAGNFMPLLDYTSEFSLKWQSLYANHMKEGIRDPIKVYEYINRYYVQEGNKRVSVLNYVGAVSAYANITRLIPRRDASNKEVSIYYEFLDFDKKRVFDNLWFTREGSFTKLVRYTERFVRENPEITDEVGEVINKTHRLFRGVYKKVFSKRELEVTTGDALVEYIGVFGYPLDAGEIEENLKNFQAQLLLIAGDKSRVTIETMRPRSHVLSKPIFKRASTVRVAFAFEGRPETMPWTRLHDIGRIRLERKYKNRITVDTLYDVPFGDVGETYEALSRLIENKPDILFTTSPNMSVATHRIALENPDIIVLNCDRAQEQKSLTTYFGKVQDTAFLCGVLAGAMTRRDRIGYMTSALYRNNLTYDVNAYGLGARIVNPRVEVMNYKLNHVNDIEEHLYACSEFAKFGADVALCQHSLGNPLTRKSFPGVFAQIYMLHPKKGIPDECIGAAACNWFVFYDSIVGDTLSEKGGLLENTFPGDGDAVHFGWGINTGLMEVYGVDAFMGHNATRLLQIFRELVKTGSIHPFTGPVFDNEGVCRIEPHDTPSLIETQNMDWYINAVTKVI